MPSESYLLKKHQKINFFKQRKYLGKRLSRLLIALVRFTRDPVTRPTHIVYITFFAVLAGILFFINRHDKSKSLNITISIMSSILISGFFYSLTTSRRRAYAVAKEIKRDLRVSELKFQSMMQNIPGAIYRSSPDLNWKMELMSDEIFKITGIPARSFLENQKNYIDIIHPQDLSYAENVVGKKPQEGTSYSIEYRIIHADGSVKWVSEHGQTLKHYDDDQAHLTGAIFDITESKHAEESLISLRNAMENAVEGIAFVDAEFNITRINEAYSGMYRKLPRDMIGKNWLGFVHKDDQHYIIEAVNNLIDLDRVPLTVRGISSIGREFYLQLVLVPAKKLHNTEFHMYGVHIFASDISVRIHEQEALALALQQAERANNAKSEFLATMSHELRTPLNAIIGYSELLLEEALEEKLEPYSSDLKKIKNAGRHLLELINDVLDVSKLEAGKMSLFFEKFNVRDMVDSIVEIMGPAADAQSNKLILICPDKIGDMYSDFTKVRQGLFNLLSNACKFTNNGAITLEIKTKIIKRKKYLNFSVSDTGCGITEEQIKKIFEPFSQADSSTTRKFGGTGLGLTITKRFCEMLEGKLDLESTYDQGSTFTILLPKVAKDVKKNS